MYSNYKLSLISSTNNISFICTIKPKIPANAESLIGIPTAIAELPINLYLLSKDNRITLLSQGTTNSAGTYSKSNIALAIDTTEIRVVVNFDNTAMSVKRSNATIYSFTYDVHISYASSTSVAQPNQTIVPEDEILAYLIWKNGMDCITLHKSISTTNLGKLEFRSSNYIETGTACHNSILGTYISLNGLSSHKDYLDKDVILHKNGTLDDV